MMEKILKNCNLSVMRSYFSRLNFSKVSLILFILGFLAYGNVIFHPFVHDDIFFIQKNPDIARWDSLAAHFLKPSSLFNVSLISNAYYRPLLDILYKIQYLAFGQNPHGYHVFNILVHVLNSSLAFLFLNLLTADRKIAFGVAILFLIHPSKVGSVTSIVGVSDLMFSLFCFLALNAYISATRGRKGRFSSAQYGVSLLAFAFGLFTKEQAVIFPFLIVLYEVCFYTEETGAIRKKINRLAGIFVIFLGYLIFRQGITGAALPSFFAYREELLLRILTIPRILLNYLRVLIFPVNLSFYHITDMLQPSKGPILGLLFSIAFVVVIIHKMPKADRPLLLFSLGWFILTLLPVLNIVPMVIEYSFLWTPEHFLYMPMLGYYLFFGLVVRHYMNRFSYRGKAAIGAVFFIFICLLFLGTTIRLNTYFRGEIPLFERAVRLEKNVGRFHVWLAKAYYDNHEVDAAIKEYQTALTIITGYANKARVEVAKNYYQDLLKAIHLDLGSCYEIKNDSLKAIEEYERALRIDRSIEGIYQKLGVNYLKLDKIDEATVQFEEALRRSPHDVMAMNNLAVCYAQKGDIAKAQSLFRKVLSLKEDFAPARQNLEKLLKDEKP